MSKFFLSNLLFALFCKFRNSICEYFTCYKLLERYYVKVWEECDFHVQWFQAETFWNRFHHGRWIWETRQEHHFNFSWIIRLWWFNCIQKFCGRRMSWYCEASLWYGRRIGTKMMDLKRRQPSWLLPCLEARVCWIIYWKLAVLMLTRLVVWMGFCTSFCFCCGLCYFNWGY